MLYEVKSKQTLAFTFFIPDKMKKLKFTLFSVFVFLFCQPSTILAQDYSTAIGLRGGPGYGLTIKQFTSSNKALEGIVSPLWEGFLLTGLYEKHAPLFKANRLNYYGGIGFHAGLWNYSRKNYNNNPWVSRYENQIVAGVDLILGLEYTFKELPFNVGVDWKPMLNLINDGSIWYKDIAVSLRFVPGNM